ncbi:MAG: sulfotransferase family protein [Anaerolineae bacterium]
MILPLWSVPRSVSTGFERMMMERGDFKVVHEPLSYFFYAKEQAAAAVGMQVDPDHPQDFDDIMAMIKSEAEDAPVFFKDMGYHVHRRADREFLSQFVNSFIIRDPAITLPSHHKLNPDFTLVEAGYKELHDLFEMVVDVTGEIPAVVDGEDLIDDPYGVVEGYCEVVGIPFLPQSLSWGEGLKPEWKTWEEWHLDAAKSTGFIKGMESFDFTVRDVPRLSEMYDECWPHYEALYEHRIRGHSTENRQRI